MKQRALGASLALHLLIAIFAWKTSRHLLGQNPSYGFDRKKVVGVRNVTEKELERELKVYEKNQHPEQVVQMDEMLKTDEAPKNTLEKTFLSQFNQRADRNIRAMHVGAFKNSLLDGDESGAEKAKNLAPPKNTSAGAKEVAADPAKLFSLANDYRDHAPLAGAGQPVGKDNRPVSTSILTEGGLNIQTKKGHGISANDDYIEGVAIGPSTLLNTQEFKYYSFYNRVRTLLVERWRTHIRREIEKYRSLASTPEGLKTGSKITRLEVKLNDRGDIQSIERLGISGIERFDQAAEISFREAGPFPHPPAEMLKDGAMVLRWDFVVVVEQASVVEFRVGRAL